MIPPLPGVEAIGWLVWILIALVIVAGILLKFWRYRLMADLLRQTPERSKYFDETMRELLQEIKMLRKEIEELRKELKE